MGLKDTAQEMRTELRDSLEKGDNTAYDVGALKTVSRVLEDLNWMAEGKVLQRLEKELEHNEMFAAETQEMLRHAERLQSAAESLLEAQKETDTQLQMALDLFTEATSSWRARMETLRKLVLSASEDE